MIDDQATTKSMPQPLARQHFFSRLVLLAVAMSSSAPSTSSHPPPPVAFPQTITGMYAHSESAPAGSWFSRSSPVKQPVGKHFAEDIRSEVQEFAYDSDIVKSEYNDLTSFLEFLNVPLDRLPSKNQKIKQDNFLKVANAMAKSMNKSCE
jgi:hypothetical protein